MIPNMRVLTLQHFGETASDNLQVTLAPMSIKMVAARDAEVQGRSVKETTILFLDSEPIELNLSPIDLMQVESVVGSYGFMGEE
jgi:hypothetical protein